MKMSQEEFIVRSKEIWGEQYDYTDTVFNGSKKPVTILCRKHNMPFTVKMAQNHISRTLSNPTGCPYCQEEKTGAKNKRLKETHEAQKQKEKEERQAKAKAERERKAAERKAKKEEKRKEITAFVQSYGYDTKNMTYKEILQRNLAIHAGIRSHADKIERDKVREKEKAERALQRQAKIDSNFQKKIAEAKLIHPEYDYSEVTRGKDKNKAPIFKNVKCPVHGYFSPRVDVHIKQKCKCPFCANLPNILSAEERGRYWRENVLKRHGEKFDLSQANYVNNDKRVLVYCRDHKRWFETIPDSLTRKAGGCPECSETIGEIAVRRYLENHNIAFDRRWDIHHDNSQCKREYLTPDFYLHAYNAIIEYNGQQHYFEIPYFHDKDFTLHDQQIRDQTLRDWCKAHNVRLLEIPYTELNNVNKHIELFLRS